MAINIHFTNVEAMESLTEHINKRVEKLESMYSWIIDGEVYIKEEKDSHKKDKVIEFKLNVPHSTLYSDAKEETYEIATDHAFEGMRRQLRKYKTKVYSH